MTGAGIPNSVRRKLAVYPARRIMRFAIQQTMITLGSALAALGYVAFQLPYNIAAGGVTGLGIIFKAWTGFPAGTFFLLANIPLFFMGFFWLGRWRFLASSTLAVITFAFFTDLFVYFLPQWMETYPMTADALLGAIYAGVLMGLGNGIIYRFGGTLGGSSIPARIIYNKKGFPLSQSYLYTDSGVILLAGLVFTMETALLAVITLVIVGYISDFVLEGASQMRTLMIITEDPEPIQSAIINELQRGVSFWEVTGGYSNKKRTMIYFTALRSRIYDVKHLVSRLDPNAFMVVGVSQQTWGGYNAPKLDSR